MPKAKITIKEALSYVSIHTGQDCTPVASWRKEVGGIEILFLIYQFVRVGHVEPTLRYTVFENGKAAVGSILN